MSLEIKTRGIQGGQPKYEKKTKMKTQKHKNIKDLNISLKELYKAQEYQVLIHLSCKKFDINLILNSNYLGNIKKADCKLSSFGANYWTRTPKGQKREEYKSFSSLQTAIKRNLKSKWEFKGEISFSLTNEILTR